MNNKCKHKLHTSCRTETAPIYNGELLTYIGFSYSIGYDPLTSHMP